MNIIFICMHIHTDSYKILWKRERERVPSERCSEIQMFHSNIKVDEPCHHIRVNNEALYLYLI